MGKQLLQAYIRLAVKEAHLARVPNQLVSDSGHEGEEDGSEEGVNEFSGVAGGGLQGFSGPLGAAPRRKRDKQKRK